MLTAYRSYAREFILFKAVGARKRPLVFPNKKLKSSNKFLKIWGSSSRSCDFSTFPSVQELWGIMSFIIGNSSDNLSCRMPLIRVLPWNVLLDVISQTKHGPVVSGLLNLNNNCWTYRSIIKMFFWFRTKMQKLRHFEKCLFLVYLLF
jgi:hypothetical protein